MKDEPRDITSVEAELAAYKKLANVLDELLRCYRGEVMKEATMMRLEEARRAVAAFEGGDD